MNRPTTFLDPDDAFGILQSKLFTLEAEEIPLSHALGRVLFRELPARLDQPRFRKAAVDGYGVLPEQGEKPFRVVGTIAAGETVEPGKSWGLAEGEAIRIMTGAVVPPDVGRVLRFEFTEERGEEIRVARPEAQTNIAEEGENIRAGDPLLSPRRLTALDIGILASQGYPRVPVYRRPKVAVISTGTELYAPEAGEIPPYAIYDSNSYQLTALANQNLSNAKNRGILGDDQAAITEALRRGVEESDVVIASGGVSMGDLDFVPAALAEIGASIHFHGLAVKPGKPTLFATRGRTLIFGLPGNPVSTAAQFEMFIAPALHAMQGLTYKPREARLPLARPFRRNNADRHEFLPGYYRDGSVHQIEYRGSGHLSALAGAELLFRIDRGVSEVAAGEEVYARFIRP
jgi:molybdopterin molybdotransferase